MGLCATIALTLSTKTVSPSAGLGITTNLTNLSSAQTNAPIKWGYCCGEIEVLNNTNQTVSFTFYKDGSEAGKSPSILPGIHWSADWEFDEVRLTCGVVVSGELWVRGIG